MSAACQHDASGRCPACTMADELRRESYDPTGGAWKDCLRYGHNAKPGERCPHCGRLA
jgi:hypothetical protein